MCPVLSVVNVSYLSVGALYEKECIDEVWTAIADKEKFTVVQTAPATRVSIGEEFVWSGDISTGQMVAASSSIRLRCRYGH